MKVTSTLLIVFAITATGLAIPLPPESREAEAIPPGSGFSSYGSYPGLRNYGSYGKYGGPTVYGKYPEIAKGYGKYDSYGTYKRVSEFVKRLWN